MQQAVANLQEVLVQSDIELAKLVQIVGNTGMLFSSDKSESFHLSDAVIRFSVVDIGGRSKRAKSWERFLETKRNPSVVIGRIISLESDLLI